MPKKKGIFTKTTYERIFFPTGIKILDFIVSQNTAPNQMGFPSGSAVEIYAPESRGKSVLAAILGRNIQNKYEGGSIVYINAETESIHPTFLQDVLHVDSARYYSIDTAVLSEIVNSLRKVLVKEDIQDKPTTIIYDSITEIKTVKSLEDAFNLSTEALNAQISQKMRFLSNFLAATAHKPIFHIFISQVRENFSAARFGYQKEYKKLYAPGGRQIKHLVPFRMFIGTQSLTDKDIPIIAESDLRKRGFAGKLVMIKHRYYGQWQYFEIPFFFDFITGAFNSMYTTLKIVEKYPDIFKEIIRKENRKYILGDLSFFWNELISYFKADQQAWEAFEQSIINRFYELSTNPQNISNLTGGEFYETTT